MADAQKLTNEERVKLLRFAQSLSKTDGWENIVTGLGTSRDKRTAAGLRRARPTVEQQTFDDLFHTDDIAATIAELPAREMVREWISMTADDMDDERPAQMTGEAEPGVEETVEDIQSVTLAKKMEQRLEELNAQGHIQEAITWARVFGGSLLFIGAQDNATSSTDEPADAMMEPLDEGNIESIDFLKVFSRWDLEIESIDKDPMSPNFGDPEIYRIRQRTIQGGLFQGTGRIHHSRVIRFDGPLTSIQRKIENSGWHDSVFIRLEEIIRDFQSAWGGVNNALTDFGQAVFKMKGLHDALLADEDNLVLRRMELLDLCRAVGRAVALDAEDEDFERKQTPLGGVPESMDRLALRLAAAARMPVTLLFGMSPAGLNATGDADIRFFYDGIKAMQQTKLRPRLERLVKLLWLEKSGVSNGVEPENWGFTFNPLWQLTDLEQADLRQKQAATDAVYISNEVVTPDEIAQSRFGGDRYSADTVLDFEQRAKDALEESELEAAQADLMRAEAERVRNLPSDPLAPDVTQQFDPDTPFAVQPQDAGQVATPTTVENVTTNVPPGTEEDDPERDDSAGFKMQMIGPHVVKPGFGMHKDFASGGKKVQAVVFDLDEWSQASARRWLRDMGFDDSDLEVTEAGLIATQKPVEAFESVSNGSDDFVDGLAFVTGMLKEEP